jgi:hypothetical protein
MSHYTRTSLRIKTTLSAINGGTAADVHAAIAANQIDAPSIKTVERHLSDLRQLGIVIVTAQLIDDRAKKIYKVTTCPMLDTRCPRACVQSQQCESLSDR